MHLVVAGDRLRRPLAQRAAAAGARVSHYYGAAELSFVAWGSDEEDLRAFPGVELEIRDGVIWVRSPYLSEGYVDRPGPFTARRRTDSRRSATAAASPDGRPRPSPDAGPRRS